TAAISPIPTAICGKSQRAQRNSPSRSRRHARYRPRCPTGSREEETMSIPREGGCACGSIRYRLASDPLITHCCHCLNCQRQTGSAFVINLVIEPERVELLTGKPEPVDVPRDDGSTQRIYRCPQCQVAVFSEYGGPALWFVRG